MLQDLQWVIHFGENLRNSVPINFLSLTHNRFVYRKKWVYIFNIIRNGIAEYSIDIYELQMGPLKAIKVSPRQAAPKLPHNYMPNKNIQCGQCN